MLPTCCCYAEYFCRFYVQSFFFLNTWPKKKSGSKYLSGLPHSTFFSLQSHWQMYIQLKTIANKRCSYFFIVSLLHNQLWWLMIYTSQGIYNVKNHPSQIFNTFWKMTNDIISLSPILSSSKLLTNVHLVVICLSITVTKCDHFILNQPPKGTVYTHCKLDECPEKVEKLSFPKLITKRFGWTTNNNVKAIENLLELSFNRKLKVISEGRWYKKNYTHASRGG